MTTVCQEIWKNNALEILNIIKCNSTWLNFQLGILKLRAIFNQ
jgi:hypothetical protein